MRRRRSLRKFNDKQKKKTKKTLDTADVVRDCALIRRYDGELWFAALDLVIQDFTFFRRSSVNATGARHLKNLPLMLWKQYTITLACNV